VTNVAPGGIRTGFSGPALVEARDSIADYAGGAHMAQTILRETVQVGDPDLAAQAILRAIDDAAPPRVLLLGNDALHYAEDEIAALSADFERWRPVSQSIARTA
jgi:hypothetical protein